MVYEQHAVQMVVLMLYDAREQACGLDREGLAFDVLGLYRDTLRPHYFVEETRYGKTAFLVGTGLKACLYY